MKEYAIAVAIQISSVTLSGLVGFLLAARLEPGPFDELVGLFLVIGGVVIGWLLGLILGGVYFYRTWCREQRRRPSTPPAMVMED